MESPVFSCVAEALERETSLDRIEARGTIRIVLKDAGLESNEVDVKQMTVVIQTLLVDALRTRGVEGAVEACERLLEAIAGVEFESNAGDSPEAVFERLGR